MQIEIDPVETKPFVNPSNPDTFYCNHCKTYSNDFYSSAVRTKYRRCRACHKEAIADRAAQMTKIDCLTRKLKYNLVYHRRRDMAKAVTSKHVLAILTSSGIGYADELDNIKTISPSFNQVTKQWNYHVVFK